MYDFSPKLKRIFPEKSGKYIAHLNFLINVASNTHYDGDAIAVPCALIEHCGFGRRTGMGLLKEWGNFIGEHKFYLNKDGTKKKKGWAKKWIPCDKLWEIYRLCFKWMKGQKRVRHVRNIRRGSHTYLITCSCKHIVRIDNTVINLEELQHVVDSADSTEMEKKSAQLLIEMAPDGNLSTQYFKNKTGRYTAIGISLQTVPKKVRKAALKGCIEYDFEASQARIINQNFPSETLTDYIENKDEYRSNLAEVLDISIKESKGVITALTYGAGIKAEDSALSNKLGQDKYIALQSIPWIVKLNSELDHAAETLTRVGYSRSQIPRSNLAYFAQEEEARCLEALLPYIDPRILLHDGWIDSKKRDIDELERQVYLETGYTMQIDVEQL